MDKRQSRVVAVLRRANALNGAPSGAPGEQLRAFSNLNILQQGVDETA
jgi:hypothetical protein